MLAALGLACGSAATPAPVGERAPSTHEVAREAVAAGRIPGISYALLRNGRIDETATLGFEDLETRVAATEATLYEAASLTKPVVALIALRLVDAGVITLDEPVADSVPAPRVRDRERYGRVTARHLLSHSAGFPNWSGDSRDPDRTRVLKFAFEPGEDFLYSGEGYGLLGELLERASGRSLVALSDELFAPLGMRSSSLVGTPSGAAVARGHFGRSPDRSAWQGERPVPAYSMMTTAADYGRFLGHVAAGGGLSPASLAEARRVRVAVQPSLLRGPHGPHRIGWSLGWGVLDRGEDQVFFQWGDNGAFRAFAAFRAPQGEPASGIAFFVNGSRGLLETTALAAPVLGDLSTATRWFSSRPLEVLRTLLRR